MAISNSGTKTITLRADKMVLGSTGGGSSITAAGGGRVILRTDSTGRSIDLGSQTDLATVLELSDDELDTITTTGILQIGESTAGSINFSKAVGPNSVSTVTLITNSTIGQTSAGAITETNLRIEAAGAVSMSTNANSVGTLAANVSGAGNALSFKDSDALTIQTVDGVSGITTQGGAVTVASGGNMTVNQAVSTTRTGDGTNAGGSLILEAAGSITLASSGTLKTTGQTNNGANAGNGGEILIASTAAGSITLGKTVTADGGAASGLSGNGGVGAVVTVINTNGAIVINDVLSANGGASAGGTAGVGGTIQLVTSGGTGTITQTAKFTATGATDGSLKVTANDNVTLSHADNNVLKVAANITVAGKFFKYTDANALQIDQVAQKGTLTAPVSSTAAQQAVMNGIKTLGGLVLVDARGTGTLNINQAVVTTPTAAGTNGGNVVLESGGALTSVTAGTITTTGADNAAGTAGNGGEIFIHKCNAPR